MLKILRRGGLGHLWAPLQERPEKGIARLVDRTRRRAAAVAATMPHLTYLAHLRYYGPEGADASLTPKSRDTH